MSAGHAQEVHGTAHATSGSAAGRKPLQARSRHDEKAGVQKKRLQRPPTREQKLQRLRRDLKLKGAVLNKLRHGLEDAKKHPRAVVGALELVEQVLDYAEAVEKQRVANEKLERRFARLQRDVVAMRRRTGATAIPTVLVFGAERANERFWQQ